MNGGSVNTYTTSQGEMWDYISRKVYGTERFCNVLMRANQAWLNVVTFNAGTVLTVPAVTLAAKVSTISWGSIYALQ
jgi:phage tail protein X